MLDGQVRGDQVGQRAGLLHVVERLRCLARQLRQLRHELAGRLAQVHRERVDLHVAARLLDDALDARAQGGARLERLEHAHARDALQHHAVVARAQPDHLEDAGDGAHLEQVGELWVFGLGELLRDDADGRSLAAEGLFDQAHRARSTDVDRHHRGRKQHRVAERQNGEGLRTCRRNHRVGHLSSWLVVSRTGAGLTRAAACS